MDDAIEALAEALYAVYDVPSAQEARVEAAEMLELLDKMGWNLNYTSPKD